MERAEAKSNDALSFRSSANPRWSFHLEEWRDATGMNRRHVYLKETRLAGNWASALTGAFAVSNLFRNLSGCRKFIRRTKWIFSHTARSLIDLSRETRFLLRAN